MKDDNDKDHAPTQDNDITSLANFLFPFIREYFESEDGRKAFDEWQQKNNEG